MLGPAGSNLNLIHYDDADYSQPSLYSGIENNA